MNASRDAYSSWLLYHIRDKRVYPYSVTYLLLYAEIREIISQLYLGPDLNIYWDNLLMFEVEKGVLNSSEERRGVRTCREGGVLHL